MAAANKNDRYIKLPAGLLCDTTLTLAEKVLLGMVFSFRKQGLALCNDTLGKILGLNKSNISRLISKLEAKGWLKITGRQSRWRRIYFASTDKVKDVLLCSSGGFTLLLAASYIASSGKQNKRNKIKEEKPVFSCAKNSTGNLPQETDDPTASLLMKLGCSPERIAEIQSQGFTT